ncbi:hypothetical protein F4808DRAFT_465413 [Astrocystis sublimbata]|nr:hypothetical protein F4808DRAFT_465413 [Astrocystis sublimbata]
MASTNLSHIYNTILKFGDYYRRRYFLETNPRRSTPFRDHLNLDLGFYHGVRDQIASVSRVWDAVLAEKVRYDTEGWPSMDRQFMESFLLCLQILPGQIKIGYLGSSLLRSTSNTLPYPDELPIILEESGKANSQVSSGSVFTSSFSDFPGSQVEDLVQSVLATQACQHQPSLDLQNNAIGRISTLEQVPIESEMIPTANTIGNNNIEGVHRNTGFRVHTPGRLDSLTQASSTKLSDAIKPPSDSTAKDSAIQTPPLECKISKPSRKRKVAKIEDREETVTAAPPAKRKDRLRGRPRRSEPSDL